MKSLSAFGFAAIAVCLVAFTAPSNLAASDEVTEQLFASWKGDGEKTKKALEDAGVDQDQIDMMLEQLPNITLTIGEDNSFTMAIDDASFGGEFKGTWELKSEDAEKAECVLIFKMEDGFGAPDQELNIKVLEMGEYLFIVAADEPPVVFKKQED